MTHVLIIARDDEIKSNLRKSLASYDLTCSFTSYDNGVQEAVTGGKPDILLLEMDENPPDPEIWELTRRAKRAKNLPVIALIPGEMPDNVEHFLDVDDLIISPYDSKELILRINRLLHKTENAGSKELIKRDDLKIDLTTCEVTVEGKIVELTFKEYELLKLLANNPGRVYTRDALLDKIWGYDYFGGDRTVDVHVRRLRSKIEDAEHTFIETVRNIGYRFIKNS
jgi:two-component system alkaline phosphatase synthesis response regulator PhoP